MKKFLSIVTALALCLSLGFAAAGCGGKGGKSGGALRIVLETEDEPTYRAWFDEFEALYAEQGYKVQITPVGGGQVQGKQDNMMSQGTPPDIIVGGDVYIMAQHRYLEPLDFYIERDSAEVQIDDFIPQILNECKLDGKQYYLPNFFNTSLLYYNKGIFDAQNQNEPDSVAYPASDWTYDDFMTAAKKLTIGSGGNYSQWGSYSTIGWWGEWLVHIRQNGGEIMNADGLVTLDTPQALKGFQSYLDKMKGANKVSYTVGELEMGGFAGKKTAMDYGGHISNWVDLKGVSGLDWDVELLPTVDGNRTGELAVDAFGIHKDSGKKEAAWALIKYLTRKKTGETLKKHPYVSCRISERDELLAIPKAERPAPQNLEAVYESLNYNKILPQQRYFHYVVTQIVQRELTKAVEGMVSAETALKNATTNANKYIRANYL